MQETIDLPPCFIGLALVGEFMNHLFQEGKILRIAPDRLGVEFWKQVYGDYLI